MATPNPIPKADVVIQLTDVHHRHLMAFSVLLSYEGIKIIQTQTMVKLWDFIQNKEQRFLFLEGPPGTGKSTTLYWLFSQCCTLEGNTPPWKAIPISLDALKNGLNDGTVDRITTEISGLPINRKLVILVDITSPSSIQPTTLLYLGIIISKTKPSTDKIVFATSSNFGLFQTVKKQTSFQQYYRHAKTIKTNPFSHDEARMFLSSNATVDPSNLNDAIELSRCIPRLLCIYVAHMDEAVVKIKHEVHLEFVVLFRHILDDCAHCTNILHEIIVIYAAVQKLPISAFNLTYEDGMNLMCVKSYLLHINKDTLIPISYLGNHDFTTLLRNLWGAVSHVIHTKKRGSIGYFFENSLSSIVLPEFTVKLRCLRSAMPSVSCEMIFKLQSILGRPYCGGSLTTGNMLRQTSDQYNSVDYVATIWINEGGDHDLRAGQYLLAVQVSIQAEHKDAKLSKLANVPTELTANTTGVLYILVNPMWQDFDEMFEKASNVVSGPGGNRFNNWWYGHPSNFTPYNALFGHIETIFTY